MPDNIRLPVFGEVPKKYAIGGGIAAVVVVGVIVVRKRSAANAAGAANAENASVSGTDGSGGTVTDPAGNVCAAVNPVSGYCPGTPEDQSFQSGGYAGVPDFGAGYGGGYGSGYVIDPAGNQCYALDPATGYCPGYNPVGTGSGSGITTNDEWLSAAMSDVPGNQGTIQAALSAVLGGLTVTTAQKDLFLEAVGINGEPPQGYPKPIKTSDTSGHPGTQKVKVPSVTGQPQEAAFAILSEAGLSPRGNKTIPGQTLTVISQSPKAGTSVSHGTVVHLTSKVKR